MSRAIGSVSANSARLCPRLRRRARGAVPARVERGCGGIGIEVSKVPKETFPVTLPLVRTGNSRSYCPRWASGPRQDRSGPQEGTLLGLLWRLPGYEERECGARRAGARRLEDEISAHRPAQRPRHVE